MLVHDVILHGQVLKLGPPLVLRVFILLLFVVEEVKVISLLALRRICIRTHYSRVQHWVVVLTLAVELVQNLLSMLLTLHQVSQRLGRAAHR